MEFNKKYDRTEFVKFLKNDFLPVDFKAEEEPVQIKMTTNYTSGITKLGTCNSLDLVVYEVEHTSQRDARVGLSKDVFRFLANEWESKALVSFVPQNDSGSYRFSLVTIDLDENSKGQVVKNYSNPRRYSYLLGEGINGERTPKKYLEEDGRVKDDNDLLGRFSVEALTKKFYEDLFGWYTWAIDIHSGVTFPNGTATEEDDREQIDTKIIRLITRLMFVWFIKQKKLIPKRIFETEYLKNILKNFDPLSTTSGIYYNAILQNLFFATLNRAIKDEEGNHRGFARGEGKDVKNLYRYSELFNISESEVIELFAEVPFLNGGLFECLDKTKTIDGVEKAYNYDGFSRNDKTFADGHFRNRAFIPNILFFEPENGLLSILKRYNFTIEENTPQDQQIALDPELLGKVFENLLGAYNPETKETARKQSGSFYTPREIVNYMVDESLIAYLGNTLLVRSIFSDEFQPDELHWSEYNSIAGRLKSIKVLDPACGSGAFPMGLLNRIVDILKKIKVDESSYQLKLNLIENCIYGSDIQSIAIQISKLRFFISLICDCEKDTSKPNFGIPTLPNLETKFVAANSLIKLKKQTGQLSIINPKIDEKKEELRNVRHQHFRAKTTSQKISLRREDEKKRSELLGLLQENNFYTPQEAEQLVQWNPYDQNAVSPFFDPEWMFGVTGGFDIVIGNPPYIQLQNNGGELGKLYKPCNFETFASTGDIYCLFYEKGWQLLKHDGHLCFITSNKWMRAGYGEKIRNFFAKKTNPELLVDFAGIKIFESATVDTNILLFSKNANKQKTICAVTNKHNKNSVKNLSVFVQQEHSFNKFCNGDSWTILSPIEQHIKEKIESVGTPLKEWDINIYRGVLTGCNEAFIISGEKRQEILDHCSNENERQRTAELIRPILRGRDIKRYGYDWANLWLIYIPWHFPFQFDSAIQGASEKAERAFKEQYPAVYIHMLGYKKELSARNKAETGIRYEWYAMQRWGANYWEDFLKPKVVWARLMRISKNDVEAFPRFCIADAGFFVVDSLCFFTGKNMQILVQMLNSEYAAYYFLKNIAILDNGGMQMRQQYIESIPLPKNIGVIQNIDSAIYRELGLNKEEVFFIKDYIYQKKREISLTIK